MVERHPWWKQAWSRRLFVRTSWVFSNTLSVMGLAGVLYFVFLGVAEGHRQLHRLDKNLCECGEVTMKHPHAGFAKLADNHWLVNVSTEDGVTGGEGRTQREALASLGLAPEEVDYLMRPENHRVEEFRNDG